MPLWFLLPLFEQCFEAIAQLATHHQRATPPLRKTAEKNLSLKSSLAEALTEAYPFAPLSAKRETGLSVFPETCPYSLADILAPEFLPE